MAKRTILGACLAVIGHLIVVAPLVYYGCALLCSSLPNINILYAFIIMGIGLLIVFVGGVFLPKEDIDYG